MLELEIEKTIIINKLNVIQSFLPRVFSIPFHYGTSIPVPFQHFWLLSVLALVTPRVVWLIPWGSWMHAHWSVKLPHFKHFSDVVILSKWMKCTIKSNEFRGGRNIKILQLVALFLPVYYDPFPSVKYFASIVRTHGTAERWDRPPRLYDSTLPGRDNFFGHPSCRKKEWV